MLKVFSFFLLTLLAPALLADSVTYWSNKKLEGDSNVEINSWSWAKVEYTLTNEKGEKVKKSLSRKDVVAISRTSEGGSMSPALAQALSNLGADPNAAIAQLENEIKNGTALNKEEAKFRIAGYFAGNANSRSAKSAADRLRDYINTYKDGFFLGEAYPLLGRMQILANDVEGARATYREMVRLGAPYDARAHQNRGELELKAGKYDDALSAFRDAAKAAGAEKAPKAKADAYAAWALTALKKWDEARTLAEPITKDESIDDPNSVDDEAALAIAYRVVGDCLIQATQAYEKGYDAHMLAAYYAWWVGGTTEGYSLGEAFFAASKLQGTDDKFKERAEKLRSALESGYPAILRAVNERLKEKKPN